MKAFVIALLLALATVAHAGESKDKKAAPPVQDFRGTDKSPLIVKGLPAEKTPEEAER